MATIHQLFIHPIKSCAGISVDSFELDAKGAVNDRRWMLVDDDQAKGKFLTQRQLPKMALIKTSIADDQQIQVSAEGKPSFLLPTPSVEGSELIEVTVWSDTVQAIDCGDEIAEWFSNFLEKPCRLVYQPLELFRQVNLEFAEQGKDVGFADGFPLLIINQSSLDFLNQQLSDQESSDQQPELQLEARRFRPNIVIAGDELAPFAERSWQQVSSGSNQFDIVKPCQRCAIPTINPDTAERNRSVWQLLSEHCSNDKKIYFGQNALFLNQAKVSTGDSVIIK